MSAADDGAADAAETAEHDDREQPRDQVVVAAGVERVEQPVDRAGRGGGRRAQAEAERRRPAPTSTPSSCADSGFCTVARTARPNRVRLSSRNSRPSATSDSRNAQNRTTVIW